MLAHSLENWLVADQTVLLVPDCNMLVNLGLYGMAIYNAMARDPGRRKGAVGQKICPADRVGSDDQCSRLLQAIFSWLAT